jgi:hypothetical protein
MKTTTFSKIKKGEYFRFPNKSKVYIYNGKPLKDGTFEYYDFDDVNNYHWTKTDRAIEIDFDF